MPGIKKRERQDMFELRIKREDSRRVKMEEVGWNASNTEREKLLVMNQYLS